MRREVGGKGEREKGGKRGLREKGMGKGKRRGFQEKKGHVRGGRGWNKRGREREGRGVLDKRGRGREGDTSEDSGEFKEEKKETGRGEATLRKTGSEREWAEREREREQERERGSQTTRRRSTFFQWNFHGSRWYSVY